MKTDLPGIRYTRLEVTCPANYTDILIAELAEAGFPMFMETENGFEADAETEAVNTSIVAGVREKYSKVAPLVFQLTSIEKENWNELWERNVAPVVIEDACLIRAAFHKPDRHYPYEIVITPKMSFGTGHHPTTYLMVKSQLTLDHAGKRVMDAGCGTAILSIMACLRGARLVEAFDIDDWSIANGMENAELNHCENIRIQKGKITDLNWPEPFDIILANINRNILLAEMPRYAEHLSLSGILQLSGFYLKDVPDLVSEAARFGLIPIAEDKREEWATLRLARSPK